MKKQVITDLIEKVAELHVAHLKTRKGASFIACLAKMESEHKGDWRALAAAEARLMLAVCEKIAEALREDD